MMWQQKPSNLPGNTARMAGIERRLTAKGQCRVFKRGAANVESQKRAYWIMHGGDDPRQAQGVRLISTCGDPLCVAHLALAQALKPTARTRKISHAMAASNPWGGLLNPPKEFTEWKK